MIKTSRQLDDNYLDDKYFMTFNRSVYADIVYCIDLTADMKPILDKIKSTVLTFHNDLQKRIQQSENRTIRQLRIRVIGFRDFYCDGAYALETSRFFYLPDETSEFENFVNSLEAKGGGDIPENSLEALALAMKSDWCTTPDSSIKKRHIIVLFTNASAHPFEKSTGDAGCNYPDGMPKSYLELVDWWSDQCAGSSTNVKMDQWAKCLIICAPERSEPWEVLEEDFDSTVVHFIKNENEGEDITTERLVKMTECVFDMI